MNIKQVNKQIIDWMYDFHIRDKGRVVGQRIGRTEVGADGEFKEVDIKSYITNGYMGYVLDVSECFVDVDNMEEGMKDLFDGLRDRARGFDLVPLVDTGKAFYLDKKVVNVYKVSGDEGTEVNIDSRLLRHFRDFELMVDRDYKGEGEPVLVFEDKELVGFVMPVLVR